VHLGAGALALIFVCYWSPQPQAAW